MKYVSQNREVLAVITHGSHLYGTNTPSSDWDFKGVYLPPLNEVLLCNAPKVRRYKFDKDSNPLGEGTTMPPDGFEVEYTPVQKFFADYLDGQAYAVEFVFAVKAGAHHAHAPGMEDTVRWKLHNHFIVLCKRLTDHYVHANTDAMVGFAMKQTFDYVHRAERLARAREVLQVVDTLMQSVGGDSKKVRLDTLLPDGNGASIFTELVKACKLETKTLTQHEKEIPTLTLNARDYMETSPVWDFRSALVRLIDKYGDRVNGVGEKKVEWKSLSHAVRVYQQVLEVLRMGTITFPRKNVEELVAIKEGRTDLEVVKQQLRQLDAEILTHLDLTTLPKADEAFRTRANRIFLEWLHTVYLK